MNMFPEERQSQICSLLEVNGRVTVTDLSRRFKVTEDCIRKDLKFLASEGKCRRVYGGATRAENLYERDVTNRLDLNQSEKLAIAKKALRFIEPKQTIYLDISSTNVQLAKLIASSGIELTAVSPMVEILEILGKAQNVTAICPGGIMHPDLNGYLGALALEGIRRFRFESTYMGTYGIDIDSQEFTTYDTDDGLLKMSAVQRAGRSYILCESRKFSEIGSYHFGNFDQFEALICDDPGTETADKVRAAGLEVI